jgi:ABC-type sulfate transport system permease component
MNKRQTTMIKLIQRENRSLRLVMWVAAICLAVILFALIAGCQNTPRNQARLQTAEQVVDTAEHVNAVVPSPYQAQVALVLGALATVLAGWGAKLAHSANSSKIQATTDKPNLVQESGIFAKK